MVSTSCTFQLTDLALCVCVLLDKEVPVCVSINLKNSELSVNKRIEE